MTAFNISVREVTGLILAGGRGSRVGGQDKGLLVYKDKPLIEHQIAWLEGQLGSICISANRNLDRYEAFGYEVLSDLDSDFQGPLHGIMQGLKHCQTEWLFVLPVDVPNLPVTLVENLLYKIESKHLAYYLQTDTREHYLSMLISRASLELLENRLKNKHNRVRDFLQAIEAKPINLNLSEDHFANLNTSDDY